MERREGIRRDGTGKVGSTVEPGLAACSLGLWRIVPEELFQIFKLINDIVKFTLCKFSLWEGWA